ncbi:hypothetical protein MMC25_007796 [Agyrium rufum]|nr:hypothetical protein [Agyrium rufum]
MAGFIMCAHYLLLLQVIFGTAMVVFTLHGVCYGGCSRRDFIFAALLFPHPFGKAIPGGESFIGSEGTNFLLDVLSAMSYWLKFQWLFLAVVYVLCLYLRIRVLREELPTVRPDLSFKVPRNRISIIIAFTSPDGLAVWPEVTVVFLWLAWIIFYAILACASGLVVSRSRHT